MGHIHTLQPTMKDTPKYIIDNLNHDRILTLFGIGFCLFTNQAPSQLYDIRGVFDGAIIKDGWNGHPTIFYTSAFTGPLGHKTIPPEKEGAETQSMAYTEDDGQTWTKLNFGANGNPVICECLNLDIGLESECLNSPLICYL